MGHHLTNIVNENRPFPRHIIIKFENTKNKKHILKAFREGNNTFTQKLEWQCTSQWQHWT